LEIGLEEQLSAKIRDCFELVNGCTMLSNIEAKYSNDPCQCLDLMVYEWLNRNYNVGKFGEPTWQKLVEAVSNPAGGANTAVARDIAGKHKAEGMPSM